MTYEYAYSIGSIIFLGITMFFYFSKSRIHNFEDKFFSYLLCCSMAALVFDLLGALGDEFGFFTNWQLYVINIIGIGSLHVCYPCFCLFLYKANDERKFIKKWAYIATFLPFILDAVLLLISPISQYGIFFIDESGIYRRGAAYGMLYFSSVIYYVTALVLVIVYYRDMEHQRNRLILVCFLVILASAVLQFLLPEYLLITSSTALAVSILYLTVQNPVDRIDPFTGCFSRTQLPKLIWRYHEKHVNYTLLIFSLRFFDRLLTPGMSESSAILLRHAAALLREHFSGDAVVYMDSMQFTVVCRRSVSLQEINHAKELFAQRFGKEAHIYPPELNIAVLRSEERTDADSMLMTLDYLLKRLLEEKQEGVLVADAEFRRECHEDTVLAAAIGSLLSEENSSLILTDLCDKNGAVAGYKALLAVKSEEIGQIYGDRLLQKADEAGLGWKYFSLLLKKLSDHAYKFSEDCKAEISIPISLCLAPNAAENIDEMVKIAGLKSDQLVLSMKEKNVIDSQEIVRENIGEAAKLGYAMRVTDFASDITNIAMFISMPVGEIEINIGMSSILDVGGQDKMLKAIIGMMKGLDKRVICSGVSNAGQAEILYGYGVDLIEHKA